MIQHNGVLPRFAVVTIDEIAALSSLPKSAIRAVLAVRMFADPRAPLDPDAGCRKSIAELAAVAGCDRRAMAAGLAAATAAGWIRVLVPGDPDTPATRSVLGPSASGAGSADSITRGSAKRITTPSADSITTLKEADPLTDPTSSSQAQGPRQAPLLEAPQTAADDAETAVCRRIDRALYEARKVATPQRKSRVSRQAESKAGRRLLRKILERHTADDLTEAIARFGRRCFRDKSYLRNGRAVPLVNLLRLEHFARNDCARVTEYLNDPSLDDEPSGDTPLGAPAFFTPAAEDAPTDEEVARANARLAEWSPRVDSGVA